MKIDGICVNYIFASHFLHLSGMFSLNIKFQFSINLIFFYIAHTRVYIYSIVITYYNINAQVNVTGKNLIRRGLFLRKLSKRAKLIRIDFPISL